MFKRRRRPDRVAEMNNWRLHGNPHVFFCYSEKCLQWVEQNFKWLKEHYFTAIVLFGDFYETGWRPTVDGSGIWRYKYKNPLLIMEFRKRCHENGLHVGCYAYQPRKRTIPIKNDPWHRQSWKTTMRQIRLLIRKYQFDMVYLDGADCGTYRRSVRYVKYLREEVDYWAKRRGFDRGYIYYHGSYSAVDGQRQGEVDHRVRNQCDYLLTKESMQPDGVPKDFDDPIMKPFHIELNCLWEIKWRERGSPMYPPDTMSELEIAIGIAENGGVMRAKRSNLDVWMEYYKVFEAKREETGGE